MAFPGIAFGYFFLAVFTLAWALRRQRHARNAVLLAASYVFYASWHLHLAGWLLAVSLLDWAVGEALRRARTPRDARALLAIGVLANLGLLAALKLYDFFRESVARAAQMLGLEAHLPVLQLLAPVGLSFYVFQGLAFLIDCHRNRSTAAGEPQAPVPLLDFLLFMAFFPKLLAGPICRGHELLPQIARPAPATVPDLERAVALVLSGLTKKLVLAGYLSTHMVGEVFQMPERHGWPAVVVALFAYSAEIYFDFSGYTDLARGLALLLGFELPENFRQPYAATNVGEFWRRWHMSFSRFLRDYIYYPLGGSRGSRARTAVNLMVDDAGLRAVAWRHVGVRPLGTAARAGAGGPQAVARLAGWTTPGQRQRPQGAGAAGTVLGRHPDLLRAGSRVLPGRGSAVGAGLPGRAGQARSRPGRRRSGGGGVDLAVLRLASGGREPIRHARARARTPAAGGAAGLPGGRGHPADGSAHA